MASSGIHSTIASLQSRLFLRWVPKWYGAFCDPKGGFYERLGSDFKPVYTGQRRLVMQCRQLSIYADFCNRNNSPIKKDLYQKFDFIVNKYHDQKTGLWHFSLNDNGDVLDSDCDLYALAFVIFSFSNYYRVSGDERARQYASQVLNLIDTKFRMDGLAGFAEKIDVNGNPVSAVRRQNPHMHLLEAALFAHATWGDEHYKKMADEMVGLFQSYFYDGANDSLVEFFNDDLSKPDPQKGAYLEPGHYFEWVWLLKKHAVMHKDDALHDPIALKLLEFANRHGWDILYGGIYDCVSKEGAVLTNTKRIWPFCEALKANALMINHVSDRQGLKDRMVEMVDVFNKKYMSERGFWTEWLNRDLSPWADYMPGTTPYHVYFGIVETMDILNNRGDVKSLSSKFGQIFYTIRRRLSGVVRGIRDYVGGRIQ